MRGKAAGENIIKREPGLGHVGFDLCDVLGGTIAQRVKGVKATVDGHRAAKAWLRQSTVGGGLRGAAFGGEGEDEERLPCGGRVRHNRPARDGQTGDVMRFGRLFRRYS